MTTPAKVLITGVNGFIGYATTIKVLQQGYHVVACVRRQSAVNTILNGPSAKPYHASGALTFVIVPDMTVLDCFVEPAKGCTYLMHIANPLGGGAGDLYGPAVKGVQALMYAAEKTESVKRILWTGAVCGNTIPFERMLVDHEDNVAVAKDEEHIPTLTDESDVGHWPDAPDDSPGLQRYGWGKAVALQKLREEVNKRPQGSYDIVALYPGWVLGPFELPQNQREAFDGVGTNSMFSFLFTPDWKLNGALGVPVEEEATPLMGMPLHIDDCAEAHANALKVEFDGRLRTYMLVGHGPHGPNYGDAVEIVRREYPEIAAKMKADPKLGTIKAKYDASRTEKELLGRKFKDYEQMVIDTMGWYKDLPA